MVFNITNEHGESVIIGDEIVGRDFSLNLQWASTSEFGNVDHIYVRRGIIGENETEISGLSLAPDNLEGNITFNDLQSYIPSDMGSYIRINATTDKGYRVYINPIFIKELPANITVANAIIALELTVRGEYSADADVNDGRYVILSTGINCDFCNCQFDHEYEDRGTYNGITTQEVYPIFAALWYLALQSHPIPI